MAVIADLCGCAFAGSRTIGRPARTEPRIERSGLSRDQGKEQSNHLLGEQKIQLKQSFYRPGHSPEEVVAAAGDFSLIEETVQRHTYRCG